MSYSPDGEQIVSGSWDSSLKVWNSSSGDEVLTMNNGRKGQWWSQNADKKVVCYSPEVWRDLRWTGFHSETNQYKLYPFEMAPKSLFDKP